MNLNLDKKNSDPKNLPPAIYNLKPNRGFTLVELLVTLSLFVILSGIVLFSQKKFNGSILLTNLAYDVALTIRQAQTFGINVREDIKTGSFQMPYGVHFDISKNKQFLIFADFNGNDDQYNGNWQCTSGGDECLNSYSIKKGNYISDICVTSSGVSECGMNKLDITFLRPDPDAIFRSIPNKNSITEAKIIISSPTGESRNVLVNSTGQISIQRN